MTIAAKHFDPQLGIDIHMYVFPPVPLPVPLPTPHIGIVLDPFDYLPFLGGTVHVNGIKRATAGTGGLNLHIPMGAYHPAFLPKLPTGPQTDDELFMGSMTVSADGDPFSKLAMPVLDCNVVGMVPPFRIRKPKKPKMALTLPTAVNLAIPTNVNVGGPPTISLMAMAMKGLFKLLGPVFKRGGLAFKKLRQKVFGNMKPGFLKCKVLRAEPVDIRSGSVSVTHEDFVVPGRLTLAWTREYGSNNDHVGACGHGWETPADIRLELDADGSVLFHGGEGVAVFPQAPNAPGLEHAVREFVDGARLYAQGEEWLVRTKEGLRYAFARPAANLSVLTAQSLPIQRIEDLCGNYWRFERQDGELVRIVENGSVDPDSGQILQGRYIDVQARGGLIRSLQLHDPVTGLNHALVRYDYSGDDDLAAAIDALGAALTFEYAHHRMLRHTDRVGLSFHYAYDDQWRVLHAWGDGGLYDYRFRYDALLNETQITDSLGHVTVVKFDENNLPLCEIDPLDGVTVFEYDEVGRTTAVVDPMGLRTEFAYDAHGNLLKLTRPDGSTLQTEYDEDDRPLVVTDPGGAAWSHAWDAQGLLLQQTTPLGATSRYDYDAAGQLVAHVNPIGAITRLAFDRHGQLRRITDALGQVSRFEHDALGRLQGLTDAAGRRTAYGYDRKGRLLTVATPGGGSISCEYDAEDQLTAYVDESGGRTRIEYCGIGRVSRRVQPDGNSVAFTYDTEEQIASVVNQRGETYRLVRDPLGRIIEEIDYWGQSRRYEHDASDRLRRSIDPLGRVIAFETDALGRITQKTWADVGDSSKRTRETFKYDKAGRLVELRNATSHVQRRFDIEGRLLQEVQNGFAIDHVYDAVGNRIERRTAAGNTVVVQYDSINQPSSIAINDAPPITVTRDALGQAVIERLSPMLTRTLSYNADGLLSSQAVTKGHAPLFDSRYDYDRAGNLTSRTDSQYGIDRYTYDPMGHVLEHTNPLGKLTRWLNDPAGDRLRTRISEVQMKQVVGGDPVPDSWAREGDFEGLHYVFDRAGNLVRREHSSEAGRPALKLVWDASQRLVESCWQSDGREDRNTTYGYDPIGRRVFKRNPAETTWFFWDGDALLSEVTQSNADTSDCTREPTVDGNVVDFFAARKRLQALKALHPMAREYVYRPGTFDPLVLIEGGRNNGPPGAASAVRPRSVVYFHNDVNGCPTRVTDGDGDVLWGASYSAWGAVETHHVSRIDQPIRFQGQYLDAETGLHYNRYRYFDPATGGFVSQDPIKLAGGLGVYEYARNAIAWADPLGLACGPAVRRNSRGQWIDARGRFARAPYLAGHTDASIVGVPKPNRLKPEQYLPKDYIDSHLAMFAGPVSKIAWGVDPKRLELGPPGGQFVMPKSVADDLIAKANGDVDELERLLKLNPGDLGKTPVRIDIPSPTGLRMPSGNEIGAWDGLWKPGGYTGGGIPEATIDQVPLGGFTTTPIGTKP